MPLKQQAGQRVSLLVEEVVPNYKGKIRLLLCKGDKENNVHNPNNSLGSFLVFICSIVQVKRKLQLKKEGITV